MKNWDISNINVIDHKWSWKLKNREVSEHNFSCGRSPTKYFGANLDVRAFRGIIKCEYGVRIHYINYIILVFKF